MRARRLIGTAYGVGVAPRSDWRWSGLLFHPQADVFGWLFGRYAYGSNVYPYNAVNAFNLYALRQPFWQPDSDAAVAVRVRGRAALALWGIGWSLAATALIVGRYLQRRDDRALLEGAMLCALAFFVLATRMHERYVYGAFLLAMPLIAFGRAGLWSSLVLTVTMYVNLAYSLAYQTVMEPDAGRRRDNLWPAISHPAALANVVLFFWLGYLYLGRRATPRRRATAIGRADGAGSGRSTAVAATARAWFDPREGTVGHDARRLAVGGRHRRRRVRRRDRRLRLAARARSSTRSTSRAPARSICAASTQFEWTHPPFTKLVIALSMLLFGGLHGLGDTAYGWRFLNVVIGALECGADLRVREAPDRHRRCSPRWPR